MMVIEQDCSDAGVGGELVRSWCGKNSSMI